MCGGFPAGWASLRFARCLCFVLVGLLGHEGVSAAVAFALEAGEPSVADGAVDEGGGHVGVAEHASPSAGLDVGGVDDAPCLVGIGYGLEREPAVFLVDGWVAELVEDDGPGFAGLREFLVEPVVLFGAAQSRDQA